jgi:hypothetical protein
MGGIGDVWVGARCGGGLMSGGLSSAVRGGGKVGVVTLLGVLLAQLGLREVRLVMGHRDI